MYDDYDGNQFTAYSAAGRLIGSHDAHRFPLRLRHPGPRIHKTVRHTDGTTATTHYGWDGDRIVREETNNQRTTVVYEPGSFVPMFRIDQSVPQNNGTAGANYLSAIRHLRSLRIGKLLMVRAILECRAIFLKSICTAE